MLSTTLKNPSFPTPGSGFSQSVPSPFLSIPGPKLGYVLVGISTKLSVQLPSAFLSPAAAGTAPNHKRRRDQQNREDRSIQRGSEHRFTSRIGSRRIRRVLVSQRALPP